LGLKLGSFSKNKANFGSKLGLNWLCLALFLGLILSRKILYVLVIKAVVLSWTLGELALFCKKRFDL